MRPSTRNEEAYLQQRLRMVERQIRGRGIRDLQVLEAMEGIPRHLFVPRSLAAEAYEDFPLPIGEGQTISQPYIVALMTEALALTGGERVLEIGTGSGYQTAILAGLARTVVSIERSERLSDAARTVLDRLEITNATLVVGDGTRGHAESAPFERILALSLIHI